MYRFGGDIYHALSVALSNADTSSVPTTSNKETMAEVCQTLNRKCHTQINKLIQEDTMSPHCIENIDLNKFIEELDPDIWKAVSMLTQPSSTKASRNENSQIRKLRQVFCICSIFFTMNRQCSFPIHTLIADAIKTWGGSNKLVRVLNRLGVCASSETHARYIQYRVKKVLEEGPMAKFPGDAFTLVSVDNIDFIHSYARVYCGKQVSSWHGTTVQIVQPKPTTLTDTLAASAIQTSLTKRPHLSPNKTPSLNSPCRKKLKRVRTGTEGSPVILSNCPETGMAPRRTDADTTAADMSVFLLSECEKITLGNLIMIVEKYALLKVASANKPLIDFQQYLGLSESVKAPEQSNIIYYKVLDQKCDNKETLLNVISDLYNEFILKHKKEHVILEGDQATYERLRSLKAEYGSELSWLIIFPGDWHVLKNYQEVLLKVYYDGGLMELARASGYQPKSAGTNFQRTHHFLVEVWESMCRVFFLSQEQDVPPHILTFITDWLENFPSSYSQEGTLRNLNQMFSDIYEKFEDFHELLNNFLRKRAEQNQILVSVCFPGLFHLCGIVLCYTLWQLGHESCCYKADVSFVYGF